MPFPKIRAVSTLAPILAGMILSGCGGEAGTGPTLPPPPPPPPPPPVPASVAISPGSAAFTALGDTLDVVAEVLDQRGATMPNATVTWRSDEAVVSIRATGDRAARITAVGAGEADLLATSGDASASVAVTVEQTPASLVAEGDDLNDLEPGTTVRVAAAVTDRNGHPAPGLTVVFRVEEGGGSVDPESAVTGAEGRAETRWTLGTSGSQALSAAAGETSARFAATLRMPASVAISPGSPAFTALGDTLDLVAEVLDQRGATMPNATVTWRSGDETVVGVRATGDRAARITAVGTGQADLLATAGDASASVAVTVEQTPASLIAEGDDLNDLDPGTTVRVAAIVADRNGHPAPGVTVAFLVEEGGGSVDPESAASGTDGRAETRWTLGASGSQALSAEAGETSARFAATLRMPASVAISPESAAFTALGDTLDLVAEVLDQRGATMPNATVTWRSGDETVVGVRATGDRAARITAVGTGQANLLATAGDASASVAVTVEQTPASLIAEGDDLNDLEPGTTVRVAAAVTDRNGHPAPGVTVVFRVEEGGGSVDPESAVTGAGGRAETRWTLGTSGSQALSAAAGETSVRVAATLCAPQLLDPDLRLGEPRLLDGSETDCGVVLEAPRAGAYYRLTLVGTSAESGPVDEVALSVEGNGPSAGTHRAVVTGWPGMSAVHAEADPQSGRRERDRRVLSWIARPDGPDPLPDLRGRPTGRAPEPPRTRTFTWGSAGTVVDNCTVDRSPTGVLLAHNDHIAIYADEALSPPILARDARVLADHYENFGQPTIQAYFGGAGDVDGDGRVLVFIEDLSAIGVAGVVWLGDRLAREDCPSSNEAELMRIDEAWVRSEFLFRTTGIVVHEAKHISSHHQLLRRTRSKGQDPFDVAHPFWVEEGTAEIAREISARLGWESIGGPPPGTMVRAAHLGSALSSRGTPEAYGVWRVLISYGEVMVSQPNSFTRSDPYGYGWGFFRFLGDWFGGAGSSRLGDAAMFARLNDAAVPVGLDGIREVTGRTFGELMIDYAQAVSVTGTGSPEVANVPRFSTYDMTGINGPGFIHVLQTGRFPYPVTTTGTGREAPIWLPLAESTTITGPIGRDGGFRIHDFRAERAGDRATVRVRAPEHIRLIVTRLPDQR